MTHTAPVRFDVLHAYAEAKGLDFNDLCRTVREAIGESPLTPLLELVGEGATVLLSSWVHQGEVTSYRVLARGMDGWRKCADAPTLDAAIVAANALDWHAPSAPPSDCAHCDDTGWEWEHGLDGESWKVPCARWCEAAHAWTEGDQT